MLTKEDIKYISQNISPEETQYVMGVSNILNDVGNEYKARYNYTSDEDFTEEDKKSCEKIQDDILIANQLMAYSNKFTFAHYVCKTDNYKYKVQDFAWQLKDCIDSIVKVLQVKYSENTNIIYNLELPSSPDPLVLLNELKELIFNYVGKANCSQNPEDYVLTNILNELLKYVCNAIYNCRLAKSAEINIDTKFMNDDGNAQCYAGTTAYIH